VNQQKSYWGNIIYVTRSLWSGLRITFNHILKARKSKKPLSIQDDAYFNQPNGIATIQYPHETLPVPDTGRYQLHNEIDDCIVCDKCVKICPVDCITIEPIRATEEIGRTSDGTPKRIYAARFDIDMGKCCFCGLCTTVCPTECLTMTKTYDFSVFDIREHNFEFAEMTPGRDRSKEKTI
jgi:formate hydrogenlyase subunit 6/NADH:ubiquinone oxidoreductase subunit I